MHEWDEGFVREIAPGRTVAEITEIINQRFAHRSTENVRHYLKTHGIPYSSCPKFEWTTERNQFLSENFGVMPNCQIAQRLGATENAVKVQAYKLRGNTMLRATPWVQRLMAISDISDAVYDAGYTVEIRSKKGKMALFCERRAFDDGTISLKCYGKEAASLSCNHKRMREEEHTAA